MKKKMLALFGAACLILCLAACGGNKAADIMLDDVTAAIQTVDSSFSWDEEKPYFEMIGAKDGWMGYIDGSPVKLYEYESKSQYDKAIETYGDLIQNWPKAGNFVLECQNEAVVTAFEDLAK